MEATQAKSLKLVAEAKETQIDTQKKVVEMRDDKIKPFKTAAEVGKIEAETVQIKKGSNQQQQPQNRGMPPRIGRR
jgi:hypothetical protein